MSPGRARQPDHPADRPSPLVKDGCEAQFSRTGSELQQEHLDKVRGNQDLDTSTTQARIVPLSRRRGVGPADTSEVFHGWFVQSGSDPTTLSYDAPRFPPTSPSNPFGTKAAEQRPKQTDSEPTPLPRMQDRTPLHQQPMHDPKTKGEEQPLKQLQTVDGKTNTSPWGSPSDHLQDFNEGWHPAQTSDVQLKQQLRDAIFPASTR